MYGTKIAAIRTARGYTQEYMGQKLGIPQNTYSKIEKDQRAKIDETLIEKIARTLGVSVEDIKSPTPIIMSFNSNNTSPYSAQNNQLHDDLVEEVLKQLPIKDEQIQKLMQIIDGLLSKSA